jgi:hypothetical protein
MIKNKRRFLLTAVAFVAIVFAVVMWISIFRMEYPPQAFDPVIWKDKIQVEKGIRLVMADQLVAQSTFLGKTRAEIVEMLGDPPPTGYFRNWDLVYWLGPERGFISIDSEWLVFRFTEDGHCREYRIVRD